MASLFGLAPDGVYRAVRVTTNAVSSYLAVSPSPAPCGTWADYSLWHFPSPRGVRPLTGILLCGARTFLSVFSYAATVWPASGRSLSRDSTGIVSSRTLAVQSSAKGGRAAIILSSFARDLALFCSLACRPKASRSVFVALAAFRILWMQRHFLRPLETIRRMSSLGCAFRQLWQYTSEKSAMLKEAVCGLADRTFGKNHGRPGTRSYIQFS